MKSVVKNRGSYRSVHIFYGMGHSLPAARPALRRLSSRSFIVAGKHIKTL